MFRQRDSSSGRSHEKEIEDVNNIEDPERRRAQLLNTGTDCFVNVLVWMLLDMMSAETMRLLMGEAEGSEMVLLTKLYLIIHQPDEIHATLDIRKLGGAAFSEQESDAAELFRTISAHLDQCGQIFKTTISAWQKCPECNRTTTKMAITEPMTMVGYTDCARLSEALKNLNSEVQYEACNHCGKMVQSGTRRKFGEFLILELPCCRNYQFHNDVEIIKLADIKWNIVGAVQHIRMGLGGHYVYFGRKGKSYFLHDDCARPMQKARSQLPSGLQGVKMLIYKRMTTKQLMIKPVAQKEKQNNSNSLQVHSAKQVPIETTIYMTEVQEKNQNKEIENGKLTAVNTHEDVQKQPHEDVQKKKDDQETEKDLMLESILIALANADLKEAEKAQLAEYQNMA